MALPAHIDLIEFLSNLLHIADIPRAIAVSPRHETAVGGHEGISTVRVGIEVKSSQRSILLPPPKSCSGVRNPVLQLCAHRLREPLHVGLTLLEESTGREFHNGSAIMILIFFRKKGQNGARRINTQALHRKPQL